MATGGRQSTSTGGGTSWPKPLVNTATPESLENSNSQFPTHRENMGLITRKFIHHAVAIVVILLQAACLDYFLIALNNQDKLAPNAGLVFLAWIAGDALVVVVFVGTYYFGAQYVKRNAPSASANGPLRHMGVLPYGWLGWLVYSAVLVGKIITAFKTFGPTLSTEHIGEINLMEFTIGGTAAVFILMLEGAEKLTTNAQKHYVRWMQHYVLLEIVDCVEFLTLLFAAAELGTEVDPFPVTLQDIILTFACINLIAPALALYRLSSRHNRHPEARNHFFLSQTIVGTVFGNLPYFIVRVYLWNNRNMVTGLFTMKNLIGIVQDSRELASYIQDVAKGRLDGSDSSLDGGLKREEQADQIRNQGNQEPVESLLQQRGKKFPFIDDPIS